MTKLGRILAIIGGVLLVIVIAAIFTIQTGWFRDFVRHKIIATVEESTGGRVELSAFRFEPRHLRATLDNFIIHGSEPPTAAPFVRTDRIQVELKLFSGLRKAVDIRSLTVDNPQVNVIVNPDGTTNIPSPRIKKESDKTALQTIVDLAVGQFDLRNGVVTYADRKIPLNLRGENVTAHLAYNLATPRYQGELNINPLHLTYAANQPLRVAVAIPVTLERDRVGVNNAKISTGQSQLTLNGALENLKDPKITAKVNGQLSVEEASQAAGVKLKAPPGPLNTHLDIAIANGAIDVHSARLALGASSVEASGPASAIQLKAALSLDEIGRAIGLDAQPRGLVTANGTASLRTGAYSFNGDIHARDVSIRNGDRRISNLGLSAKVEATPDRINLPSLDLAALGGRITGSGSIENRRQLAFNGRLQNLDLSRAAEILASEKLPYDGIASGPIEFRGDLQAPGISGVSANARLSLAPARRAGAKPVSGQINATYRGASNQVEFANSYLRLPSSELRLSGILGRQLQIDLNTRDLADLAAGRAIPVQLGGPAQFHGAITGPVATPRVTGTLDAVRFSIEGRRFDSLNADVDASPSKAALQNLVIRRGPMSTTASASLGLKNWKPLPDSPLSANADIRNGDLADILALAGQASIPASGALTAQARIGGVYSNPTGTADLNITQGQLYQEPFDSIQGRVEIADQLVRIPALTVTAPAGNLELTGNYRHPRNTLTEGDLQARLVSNGIDLARVRNVTSRRPNLSGSLNLNAEAAASIRAKEVQPTSIAGDFGIRQLKADGQNYGDLTATARTSGGTVTYQLNSDFAGSTIKANGQTRLTANYPTSLQAALERLPVERVLTLANHRDIPVAGIASGHLSISGDRNQALSGGGDLTLANATIYQEKVQRAAARFKVTPTTVDVEQLNVTAGESRLALAANYTHPTNDLKSGSLTFRLEPSTIQLGGLKNLEKIRPGLNGTVTASASGAATLKAGDVLFSALDADVNGRAIRVNRAEMGSFRLTAKTANQVLNFQLDSDLAGSKINGSGQATLRGDYPLNAKLTFDNVTWDGVRPLVTRDSGPPPQFEASLAGNVSIDGPARNWKDMRGALELARVRLAAKQPREPGAPPFALTNDGPVRIVLNKTAIQVQSARLTGPKTHLEISGGATTEPKSPLNLTVKANSDLSAAQELSRDIYSSGQVTLDAVVRGTMSDPLVNGRLQLNNASVNYIDLPVGLSNANGTIAFNGNSATVERLTAESGGGKVTLSGLVARRNGLVSYNLQANGRSIRIRYPEGLSVVANTNVTLTGSTENSIIRGIVIIQSLGFSPRHDFGSTLSRTASPIKKPEGDSGPLDSMRLDIRVRTSATATFETSLAQSLQADANLHLRGTAGEPGLVGRVNITEGRLIFFGTQYTVNQGAINFYNPIRIEPVLNIDLQTIAKGVNVNLNVSGPMDNMQLTYTSDPPLQFSEVVALLATGRTPTSDPNLLAREPAAPQQSLQQMGQSAILSQAIVNPVASRLERVFGVSQLKIDPTFTSGSDLPQARMTLQQQVAPNVTFTYITNLTQTNSQIIRVEWALNETWSLLASREENGRVGLDFFYKKQFR